MTSGTQPLAQLRASPTPFPAMQCCRMIGSLVTSRVGMDGNLPLGCTSDATLNSPCVSGTSNRTETIRTWMARVCRGVSGSLAINGSCSLGSSGGHPSRHFFWRSHLPSRFQHQSFFRSSTACLWCFPPSSVLFSRCPHHSRGLGTWTHDWWIHAGVSIHRR